MAWIEKTGQHTWRVRYLLSVIRREHVGVIAGEHVEVEEKALPVVLAGPW